MLVRDIQQADRQFQCDLDKLMKDIRHSEQIFQTITQHILKIINTSQSQNFIFVNQDISHYRTIITKLKNVNNTYEEEYSSILERYMQVKSLNQSSIILMRRVTYRLLQIIFNSVGSINYKFPHILQEYLRLKINCQQIMQENTSYKPYPIFKYITEYSFKKINKYLDLFNELTNHLQNGHLDRFTEGQINYFLENYSVTQVKFVQTAKNTFFSTLKINKIRVKQKLSAKPQIYTLQNNTNTFSRKAKKFYDNLKDVIEVNKQEFIEGYTSFNQKNKDNLFKELLNRNKVNRQAIIQFSHKKKKIQNVINKTSKNERLEQTQSFHANQQSSTSLDCKPINTTRRSLLVKLKANENSIKILPSQLFRKTSKIQYSNRIKLKGYQRERNNEKGEGKLLGDRLKQVLGDNNQEDIADAVKQQNLETIEEKLPFLSKRAQSVDQNYKLPPQPQNNQVRTLSNSLKINEDFKIKSKIQKAQIHPVKVKLELKSINILASLQVSKKSVKLGEMSKCLYF